jgi:hypothetical protein
MSLFPFLATMDSNTPKRLSRRTRCVLRWNFRPRKIQNVECRKDMSGFLAGKLKRLTGAKFWDLASKLKTITTNGRWIQNSIFGLTCGLGVGFEVQKSSGYCSYDGFKNSTSVGPWRWGWGTKMIKVSVHGRLIQITGLSCFMVVGLGSKRQSDTGAWLVGFEPGTALQN